MHHNCSDRLRLSLCHVKHNDRTAAIAENEGTCLADRTQHGHRVAALLADLEVLGDVHRAA